MKPKIAIVRGAFLNAYEMQFFEPLLSKFDITAFSSLKPFHDKFKFPVKRLPSPMDVPEFPYKMPILNRIFIDAHYLYGLEKELMGFDIVHSAETYYRYTQQSLDAKRSGQVKKVIATILENIPFNNEGIKGRKVYKARARKELDHMIALTQKTKDALITEGVDPKKITIIRHYIDAKKFIPNPHHQKNIANSRSRTMTILYTGRLEKNKGVLDVLSAIRYLMNEPELQQYHLAYMFVGSGTLLGQMVHLERKYGVEKFVTHTSATYEQMPEIYQQADIFIAPSIPTPTWEEQYNTALLEAQASGLPIITTSTGGIAENVGDAAILVKPGDIQALTRALKQFILDCRLRKEYAQRARRRAVNQHDISFGVSKLSALYESLL